MKANEQNEEFLRAYDKLSDAIFRYCYFKTSKRDLALDLAQETFTKTWEYLREGNQVKNLKAFLYKVASNLIIDEARKRKVLSLDEITDHGFDYGIDEKEKIEGIIDGKKAAEILKEIGEKYREVIMMRYLDELSVKEIAKITDQTENSVSVRLHRGLQKLNEILSKYESR